MVINREIEINLLDAATQFPVVALLGPKHSGKTTLAQKAFPNHAYLSLEDFDTRDYAKKDPRSFLGDKPSAAGLIIDEIQNVPELLSYMQTIVDREKKKGFFVVTGSQNFLVDEAITQTLAGRIAIFTLLPLSISELAHAQVLPEKIDTLVLNGSYPQIYSEKILTQRLYSNYIHTYVERDVRQIKNIHDLDSFRRFITLCAGRIGQVISLESLGNDAGINQSTVKAWISLLEKSYILFLLYPYYNKYGRRLVKAPKLYFVDTGIACWLLNIKSAEELSAHYQRGNLIESLMITDLLKQQHNLEQRPNLYFWRDKTGNEIDCIIDRSPHPIPVEIKAGKTVISDFFKGFDGWLEATKLTQSRRYVIYGGTEDQNRSDTTILGWKSAATLIKNL